MGIKSSVSRNCVRSGVGCLSFLITPIQVQLASERYCHAEGVMLLFMVTRWNKSLPHLENKRRHWRNGAIGSNSVVVCIMVMFRGTIRSCHTRAQVHSKLALDLTIDLWIIYLTLQQINKCLWHLSSFALKCIFYLRSPSRRD